MWIHCIGHEEINVMVVVPFRGQPKVVEHVWRSVYEPQISVQVVHTSSKWLKNVDIDKRSGKQAELQETTKICVQL